MNNIAVQLLVGQNDEPFLPYAIRSVSWADYFTVVNTAPKHPIGKENTYAVKTEIHPDKLRYDTLEPDQSGHFSFADARNKCLAMTDPEDIVFIVDADDVHYPEWESVVRELVSSGADSITAHFYHLMVYKDIFQYVQPREILYKNYPGTSWMKGVHEILANRKSWPVVSNYHYMHYGYIKPQNQVFTRWKFYSDLDGDFHHYDGQNPNTILDDRITVSKPITVDHPPVIKEFLESYPECPPFLKKPNRETVPVERVGLILITYNDAEILPHCLESLRNTPRYPDWQVLALDMGSDDNTVDLLLEYQSGFNIEVVESNNLLPLAETLNFGLDYFRVRHDIQYIGWIHPDMRFDDPNWLKWLWQDLQDHPKIGKICAANTRVPLPEKLMPGQEQCFVIRKDIVNKVGLFDEEYRGIGGYEDWDYNRRILNHDGYKVMMSARAHVYHKGCGTREKRDTSDEQIYNYQYYAHKWGDGNCPV